MGTAGLFRSRVDKQLVHLPYSVGPKGSLIQVFTGEVGILDWIPFSGKSIKEFAVIFIPSEHGGVCGLAFVE